MISRAEKGAREWVTSGARAFLLSLTLAFSLALSRTAFHINIYFYRRLRFANFRRINCVLIPLRLSTLLILSIHVYAREERESEKRRKNFNRKASIEISLVSWPSPSYQQHFFLTLWISITHQKMTTQGQHWICIKKKIRLTDFETCWNVYIRKKDRKNDQNSSW